MTAPEHAHSGSEQANEQADLRQRIATAIHAAVPTCADHHATDCTDCAVRAHAAISVVVQPVLDRISKDLTCAVRGELQARADLGEAQAKIRIHKRNTARWKERAEAAEAELAAMTRIADRYHRMAEAWRAEHQQIGDQP